jgi:hypothetical protein
MEVLVVKRKFPADVPNLLIANAPWWQVGKKVSIKSEQTGNVLATGVVVGKSGPLVSVEVERRFS